MADSLDWLLNDNMLPKCSCSECDSMTCFAQRYKCQREKCTCGYCKESESCQFYTNNKPPCCLSSDSNKKCSCGNLTNRAVKNVICGTSDYKNLGVNQDYYSIYVNKKQMKSFQSNFATDKLNIYCQNEYKMRKNIQDYYDIYVNRKTSSKQTDTTSLNGIKCNQCNPTTDKIKSFCDDVSIPHRNIKDYYDIYVNKKPSSKQTDTASLKEIKSDQCNSTTNKFAIYYGDEYDARKIIKDSYDIYVNQNPSSKQADTPILKQICPSNPTTDKCTMHCGDESLDSSTRKSINNYYDISICVSKKQSSTQTDPVPKKKKLSTPAANYITFSCGNYCKMCDIGKYDDDIDINGKQSSKHTDIVTLKPSCCTSLKCKKSNPANDRYSIYYGNENNTRKNINKLYDIYVNKNHSSTQTDPVPIMSKQANAANNHLTFSCGSDSRNHDIHKYYHDIYVNGKKISNHTDSDTLKPIDCASMKSKQSNPADIKQTNQCKVCGRNIYKSDININKKQSLKQTDIVTKEYMDSITTKQIEPISGQPYKVKEYETSEYIYDDEGNITTVTKKLSTYLIKPPVPRDDECAKELEKKPKKNITQIHNVSISNDYPYKNSDPLSGKTSAQIMDVLYNDFKESVASTNTSKNTPIKTRKLTEYDIIKKIKEAYKACSCKICECVVALTVSNMKDQCNCKPCECIDCSKYQSSLQLMDSCKQVPGSGCPCIRCNSSKCKGISDSKREMCDCPEYTKDFSKPCSCKSCQCIECKSMFQRNRTWVVAPVDQTSGRNICNCSPCDCLQCAQAIGATSNRTHEISTGINRHPNCHCEACNNDACIPDGNPSCNCASHHGVTRKPVSRGSHDFDVRRSLVDQCGKCRRNHDTITMYAAVSNTYPRSRNNHFNRNSNLPPAQNKSNINTCKDLVCFDDNIIHNKKSTRINTPTEIPILINKNIDNVRKCGCSPCECHICNQNNVIEECTQELRNNKYKCNVWDIIRSSASKCTPTKHTRDVTDSEKCTDNDIMISNESQYPYKKEKLLIPSICYCKNFGVKDIKTKYSLKKSQTSRFNIQQECSKYCNVSERHSYEREQQEQQTKKLTRKRRHSRHQNVKHVINLKNCEYDSYTTQCEKYNRPTFCGYNNNKDVKMSNDYISGYSSVANLSKISDLSENSNITPIHREQDSWESSCNSSKHDCQDYLVTFPKAAVVDYIEDVMKLKMDKDPKLDQISKILYKINTENGKYMKRCNKNCKMSKVDSIDKKLQNLNNNIGAKIKKKTDKSYSRYNRNNLFNKCKAQDFDIYCVREIGLQTQKSTSGSSLLIQDCLKKYATKEILPLPENINSTKLPIAVAHNRIQLFDNVLIPDKQVENSMLTEHNCFWKNDKPLQDNKNINMFNSDEDLKRAQSTLKQAREFSSELMQILARYEKANREFESLSEKFKHAREPVFDGILKNMRIKISEVPTMNKGDGQIESLNVRNEKEIQEATKLMQDKIDDNETNRINISNLPPTKINSVRLDTSEDIITSPTTIEYLEVRKSKESFIDIDEQKLENCMIKTDTPTEKSDINLSLTIVEDKKPNASLIKNIRTSDFEEYKDHSKINVPQIMRKFGVRFDSTEDIITSPTNHDNVEVIESNYSVMDMDEQKLENCMIKTETLTEKSEDKSPSSSPIKTIQSKELEEYNDPSKIIVPRIMRKFGVRFGSTEEIIASPITIDDLEVKQSKYEPEQPIEVLVKNESEIKAEPRKNYCMHYNGWHNSGGYNSSLLDDNIQMTVNSISMQTSGSLTLSYELDNSYENKTLVDLQVQVSGLLNMPLLQTLDPIIEADRFSLSCNSPLQNNFDLRNINHKCCHNGSLTMSSQSSYDSCKVCFRNLHRVSDHTVLVKWQIPKAIEDIQGYELLVDGLPVETFSPSRCMAVVTCLPRSDKVLLTIRTLTSKHTEEGYYPTANIVYRPRIK